MINYQFDVSLLVRKTFKACAAKRGASDTNQIIVNSEQKPCAEFINSDAVQSYLYLISNVKAHVLFRRKIFDAQIYGNESAGVILTGSRLASSPFEARQVVYHTWQDWMLDATLQPNGQLDFSQAINSWLTFTKTQHGKELNPVDMSKIVFIENMLSSPILGEEFLGALTKNKKAMEHIEMGMTGLNMNR